METDGILVVHTRDPDAAQQGVELTLTGVAEEWRVTDKFRTRNGVATFAVLLQLKDKKGDPLKLLEEIDERYWRGEDIGDPLAGRHEPSSGRSRRR